MAQPPGPRGGRLLGNGLSYEADRIGFLTAASREYGDVWAYGRNVYVVAGAELSREVLTRTGYEFGIVPGFFPPRRRSRDAPPAATERSWVHAASMRGLRPAAVRLRVAIVAEEADALAAGCPGHTEVAVLPWVRRTLSRIGARFLFGPDADALAHGEQNLFRLRETVNRQIVPLPPWVPAPTMLRVRHQRAALGRQVAAVLRRRRSDGVDEPDVLGMMTRPSTQYGVLADQTIVDALVGLMIAAHEVPTRGLGWLLLTIARHAEVQARVAEEAVAVLPADPRHTTAEHLDGLRYTTSVVREVLRLHPPTWLMARTVDKATDLGGYPLRAGMRVMVSPYLLHHDVRYHPDPDRFDPARWRTGADTCLRDHGYLPFGTGPRSCDGAALAEAELTLIAAHLARRHHLTAPTDQPYQLDTTGGLTPEDLRLTFHPHTTSAG